MSRISPTKPENFNGKLAFVGEAPGKDEDLLGTPFVGASGQELTRILREVGIARSECYLTNVFLDRPESNNIETLCGGKREVSKLYFEWREEQESPQSWPASYIFPALTKAKYLLPTYLPELRRLQQELEQIKPNLVVALGNTACWALLGTSGISKMRGTTAESTLIPNQKILPTYHPAAILRKWDLRPILVADLIKARRESQSSSMTRPQREIWLEPSIEDILSFEKTFINPDDKLAFDIETQNGQITCIGIAPNPSIAIVIPFVDKTKPNYSYFSPEEEGFVLAWLWKLLEGPNEKIAQNGLYDIQWIWRKWGIRVSNFYHDTMLLHHALQPELQKSLGFLGSIYTDEASWKLLRPRGEKAAKREE